MKKFMLKEDSAKSRAELYSRIIENCEITDTNDTQITFHRTMQRLDTPTNRVVTMDLSGHLVQVSKGWV